MTRKNDGRESNRMKKRHEYKTCDSCGCRENDLTMALENEDYDKDPVRKDVLYIYCQECGNSIEIKKK
jgi:hypothetical protein